MSWERQHEQVALGQRLAAIEARCAALEQRCAALEAEAHHQPRWAAVDTDGRLVPMTEEEYRRR